ncbi:hypothetical protein CAPTEDRAFT_113596 [Capitella teleta]|uniref:Glutathione transferase n=1 Tax=Capitella teleta TaxID=283909 RepID=R7TID3_CAPTE|nr:hypothetical protein CAPTEDRAFT_113596 [Capitella teleta]|eukprot:ELT93242.1 hypothetical protein CAPTEDRAFT_113596 [Capitella teleta]
MAKYRLYYFDSRGRAEYARLIMVVAGVEYEDVRVKREDWPELKKDMPFGQMPVLVIDGKQKLAQSYPIARYLAKKHGLAGKTNEENLRIDMFVDCQEDFNLPLVKFAREQDPIKKAALKKTFEEEIQTKYLAKMEEMLIQNEGGDGWFCGNNITWADLSFLHGTSWPMEVFGMFTPWDDFPKLKAWKQRVSSHPKVAEWLVNRPKTPW